MSNTPQKQPEPNQPQQNPQHPLQTTQPQDNPSQPLQPHQPSLQITPSSPQPPASNQPIPQPTPEDKQQQYHKYDNIMEQNHQYREDYNGNDMDDIDQEQNPISIYESRMSKLQQKQEILKYSISDHQEAVKQLFMNLYNKKKKLLQLITEQYNKKSLQIDISLMEQFEQMKKTIQKQEKKIQKLRSQIQEQSISTINLVKSSNNSNERNVILLRQKRQQIQSQIQSGSRFAASQYVRDYLERTYIHKVSYEDVKYEYEIKTKLRQNLKIEKQAYEKKKQEIKKSIEKEGMLKVELQEQKNRLEALLAKAVK